MRKLLNLGHTFAHAIEMLSGYSVSHGRAVATGIAMVARAAAKRGCLQAADCGRIEALVSAMGSDTRTGFAPADLADAIRSDKKVSGDSIDMVMPQAIGKCFVSKVPLAELGKVAEDAC